MSTFNFDIIKIHNHLNELNKEKNYSLCHEVSNVLSAALFGQ